MIQSGQLRALAVTSEKRWFSLPNVPTMIEAGYPGFVSDTFQAVLAPAAVPAPILATLVKESRAAFQKPECAGAGAQGRLRDRRRNAGAACRPHQGGDPGGARAGGEGRHSGSVDPRGETP